MSHTHRLPCCCCLSATYTQLPECCVSAMHHLPCCCYLAATHTPAQKAPPALLLLPRCHVHTPALCCCCLSATHTRALRCCLSATHTWALRCCLSATHTRALRCCLSTISFNSCCCCVGATHASLALLLPRCHACTNYPAVARHCTTLPCCTAQCANNPPLLTPPLSAPTPSSIMLPLRQVVLNNTSLVCCVARRQATLHAASKRR